LTGLEEERRTKREIEELRKVEEEEDFVDPSILLYGLEPQQQQLLLTYNQAGGGVVGGSALGGYGNGANVPLIGWNQAAAADPMAAYTTYALGGGAAANAMIAQQAYMTGAANYQTQHHY